MPFSSFSRFGNGFRFSSRKPLARAIYDSFKSSNSDSFETDGPISARWFANAMGLARARSTLERAKNQADPLKCWDLLRAQERHYGIAVPTDATLVSRRQALAAKQDLVLGPVRANVEYQLSAAIGDDFVAWVTTPASSSTDFPGEPWADVGIFGNPPHWTRIRITESINLVPALGVEDSETWHKTGTLVVSPALDEWLPLSINGTEDQDGDHWVLDAEIGKETATGILQGSYEVEIVASVSKNSGSGTVSLTLGVQGGAQAGSNSATVGTSPVTLTFSGVAVLEDGFELQSLFQFNTAGSYTVHSLTFSVSPVLETGVNWTNIGGEDIQLSVGDRIVIEPYRLGCAELVTLTEASATRLNAVFTKAHEPDSEAILWPHPFWFGLQKHSLVVVPNGRAEVPDVRQKANDVMRRLIGGTSTWDVVEESTTPGSLIGFVPGIGAPGITPIQQLTF